RAGVDQLDGGTVSQLIHTIDYDAVVSGQAVQDLDPIALGRPQFQRPDLHRVVGLYEVRIEARRAPLNRGRRDRQRVVDLLHVKTNVDELIRKQDAVAVGKLRLQLHRSGGRVDLIVGREQRSGAQQRLAVAVVRVHLQRAARGAPPLQRR